MRLQAEKRLCSKMFGGASRDKHRNDVWKKFSRRPDEATNPTQTHRPRRTGLDFTLKIFPWGLEGVFVLLEGLTQSKWSDLAGWAPSHRQVPVSSLYRKHCE
jgi:hypothetical protein